MLLFFFSIVNQCTFFLLLFLNLNYLQDPFLYFSFRYFFITLLLYPFLHLHLDLVHTASHPWRPSLCQVAGFGCLERIGDMVLPVSPLSYVVFMNSLCYFSYYWKVGFLHPQAKAIWNTLEHYQVQWIIVAHWNGSTLASFYSTKTYRNSEPQ